VAGPATVLDSMKDSLTIGIRGRSRHLVDEAMSPAHLPTKVLSTPSMIGLIEQTCLATAQEHLDDGETTVGVHVCVSHSASVKAGETIDVACELTEIDRRRLVFETTVTSGDAVVSEGTHQRFVVRPGG
jgi:fluoroacetyl-CoA thioesterase